MAVEELNTDHFAGAGKMITRIYHFANAGKMVELGKKVRAAIQRIGGTMPEDIPPVEHIKQAEKRLKSAPAKLKFGG